MTATSFDKVMHDKATETATMFAKMQCAGHYTAIEKSGWIDIINRHSTALYGDASPRNFTECITENEEGRLFYRAHERGRAAPRSSRAVETPEMKWGRAISAKRMLACIPSRSIMARRNP